MNHGDVITEQFNGLCENLFSLLHVFNTEQIHRIKDDPQIAAADRIEYDSLEWVFASVLYAAFGAPVSVPTTDAPSSEATRIFP